MDRLAMDFYENEELLVYDLATGARYTGVAAGLKGDEISVRISGGRIPRLPPGALVKIGLLRPAGLFSRQHRVSRSEVRDGRAYLDLSPSPDEWSKTQRREYFRASIRMPVVMRRDATSFRTWTVNLCGNGMLVLDPDIRLSPGDDVTACLDCSGRMIELEASVVREHGAGASRSVGVHFRNIDEQDRDMIVRIVFKAEIDSNRTGTGQRLARSFRMVEE